MPPVTPPSESSPIDARSLAAWRSWLVALATDSEAALSAAFAYEALDAAGRDLWLAALDEDARCVDVPRIALYAPLLGVENDEQRRARIEAAMGEAPADAVGRGAARALRGTTPGGDVVVVLVLPLYLDFVHEVSCRVSAREGFVWVRHEPLVGRDASSLEGLSIEGASLEAVPLRPVVDEIARAVLDHRRAGRALPSELVPFATLLDASDGGEP